MHTFLACPTCWMHELSEKQPPHAGLKFRPSNLLMKPRYFSPHATPGEVVAQW